MKINTKSFLLFLSLILVVPIFSSENLKFTTIQGSAFPYVAEKVVKEAYRRIGIDIIVDFYPGKRSLILSNEGKKYDGELYRIGGVEKRFPNLIPIPVPIHLLEGMVFTKDTKFDVNGWDSLRPYKIGVRRGIAFTFRGTQGMNSVPVNSNKQLFEMLDKGRLDIVVLARMNALKYFQKTKFPNIKILEPAVEVHKMYHYVHKKNAHLIPKLVLALKDMEKEGLIKQFRNEHIQELLK